MRIGELCTRRVATIAPDATIATAATRMADEHVGDLVVVRRGCGVDRPIGIITDRDIVVKVVALRRYPDATQVHEVMTRGPIVANASDDIACAFELASAHGVRRLPVVAADGELVGIVALDDLLGLLAKQTATLAATLQQSARRERAEPPLITASQE